MTLDHKQMAFTVNDRSAIAPIVLVHSDHHLHLAKVGALYVHIEWNIPRRTLPLGYIVAQLNSTFHNEEDLFRVITLAVKYIFRIYRHWLESS